MSLGIAFKGPEGIVLAADSRVTLMAIAQQQQQPGAPPQQIHVPATYDNATKLLQVEGQRHVGAVTYGLGALGTTSPRTAHSYMPEFEAELAGQLRLPTQEFAQRLSAFFVARWQADMPNLQGPDMVFLVGGYDNAEPYGRLYEFSIPGRPDPFEQQNATFGMVWGGQREYTDRLITGFDERALAITQQVLGITDPQRDQLRQALQQGLQAPIPFAFLPLQDCLDLAVFLIRATIQMQTWVVGLRGVGGAIDVATVTRIEGFTPVQRKSIRAGA